MGRQDRIQDLRQRIDALDRQILHLLNERAEIVLEVGKVKLEEKIGSYDPDREAEILRHLIQEHSGPFPKQAIVPVFREIVSACRLLERKLAVIYLGPPASHTHQACVKHFGISIEAISSENIWDIFESVEKEKVDFGIVPIENSTEGVVNQTLDMFIGSEVKIWGEIMVQISHDLLSKSGRCQDIRKIVSHPSALAQCREWLRKNFPEVEKVETASTAKAAQLAVQDKAVAAVAGSLAARLYGLKVIESKIEDHLQNYTRFLILSHQFREKTGRDRTSILFSIPHSPGSLFRVLKPFDERKINLTKIESRPVKNKPWEYIFFLDFEGHVSDAHIHETLKEMEDKVLFMKFLGSYPRNA
ncbi:MAG: prephenate dehydratase [Thermodesulfobacteriota bacterium]|nr:prephenate dehydratase [Thermodesulfobacteriota bacterium]